MVITKRQQAIDLIEQYDIDDGSFLAYLVSDYMSGNELLEVVKTYLHNELGIDTNEEAE